MRTLRFVAVVASLLLVAVACGKEGGPSASNNAVTGGGGQNAGPLVLGAEQFPECLNPIDSCANASWEDWAVVDHVLEKAMTITPQGTFEATPLLTEAPTLANGDLTQNPFSVKYKINPKAVWDDGTPVTSKDFEFTWQAHMKTKGSIFTTGYDKITSVDTTDPHTAIVHYSQIYADWPDNFGGNTDYVLKAAAFPKGPDISGQVQTNIPFSDGPYKLTSFNKNELVLTANDKWWGPKPNFSPVTVVPRTDSNTEVTSLLSGEVSAIYPQPSVTLAQRLKSNPKVKYRVGGGSSYEGVWLNLAKAPLNDIKVREALFWATDREAVVNTIIKPSDPDAAVLNCAGWVPNVGPWCDNTQFANFHYDPNQAKSILTADGYKLGSDGIFAKNGQRLSLTFSTTTGNKGREDTEALLKEKWKAAGIEMVVKNYNSPSPIFTDILPKGNFQVAEYAQVASPDPGVTSIYACDQIPSAANQYAGQNFSFWCNQQATNVMKQSDLQLDPAKRLPLIKQVGAFVRQDLVWLPLYQKPLITAWRTDKIGGPIGAYNETGLGGFYNLYAWTKP